MGTAGWTEIWHLALANLAREPSFLQILIPTVAVLVLVMAAEGCRSSLLAMWHANRIAPPAAPPALLEHTVTLAAPETMAPPPMKGFCAKPARRAAMRTARKTKLRRFKSPRPTIRRYPMPEHAASDAALELGEPMELSDAI